MQTRNDRSRIAVVLTLGDIVIVGSCCLITEIPMRAIHFVFVYICFASSLSLSPLLLSFISMCREIDTWNRYDGVINFNCLRDREYTDVCFCCCCSLSLVGWRLSPVASPHCERVLVIIFSILSLLFCKFMNTFTNRLGSVWTVMLGSSGEWHEPSQPPC